MEGIRLGFIIDASPALVSGATVWKSPAFLDDVVLRKLFGELIGIIAAGSGPSTGHSRRERRLGVQRLDAEHPGSALLRRACSDAEGASCNMALE